MKHKIPKVGHFRNISYTVGHIYLKHPTCICKQNTHYKKQQHKIAITTNTTTRKKPTKHLCRF